MAYASPITICHSGITNKANFDLFVDDEYVAQDLATLNSDYLTTGIPCAIDIVLDTTIPCQVKINNKTWQNFMLNTGYSIPDPRTVKSVILSADNVKYNITIMAE